MVCLEYRADSVPRSLKKREMSMSATLDALQALQQVTLKLTALRSKIERKQRSVQSHDRRQTVHEAEQAAKHEAIMQRQSAVDQLELEIKAYEAQTIQLRESLNKTKTNKEYAGILEAMNTEKADTAKIEAVMLDVMKEMETFKATEDVLIAERDKLSDQIAKSDAAIVAFDEQVHDDRERLEAERRVFAENLPPSAMAAFTRAAQRHDGEAMGAVVKPRPREDEYWCAGCNMKVTLEVVNSLQTRDEVQMCGSCGRILCLENGIPSRPRA